MMKQLKIDQTKPKVALVIGAGGIKCAAALGVFDILQASGIYVDLLVGCSAGSIYAAFLAAGLNADEAEAISSELWTREITQQKNPSGYLMSMMPRHQHFKRDFALRDDRLILERLRAAFAFRRFQDNEIPLLINATDFDTGAGTVFSDGDVVDAIRASVAVPSLFRPWSIDGRLYCDGVLSNPLPIDVAAAAGADLVIAICFKLPMPRQVTNARRYNIHLNTLLTNNLIDTKIDMCQNSVEADVVVIEPQFDEYIHQFDTQKVGDIVAAGRMSALEKIDDIYTFMEDFRRSRYLEAA